ncbi:MAG: ABC transporter permease [Chloroflexota bacterium]
MAIYLAVKEVLRNKGRFFLFSLVIALITTLVLFIAALGQGLAEANKQYLEKINAELIVFQKNVELSTTASRIARDKLNDIRRVPGVKDLGPVGLASATFVPSNGGDPLDVSLIGVEPGKPGMPPVIAGSPLRSIRANQTIIDKEVATRTGLQVGDKMVIKTIQGSDEEFTTLDVIGITDSRQFFFAPSIFVPFSAWENIRPQPNQANQVPQGIANIVAVQISNPREWKSIAAQIQSQVSDVEVVDPKTAYEAAPGYQAQQSTLNTQRGFTLLIGILVIGGFFQIQTLQKVPQIGVQKAIGASNHSLALAVILQIIFVTFIGVLIGAAGTMSLSLFLPKGIPIIFTGETALIAIVSLLMIGPIGGMVSVRLALKVEPLAALGM